MLNETFSVIFKHPTQCVNHTSKKSKLRHFFAFFNPFLLELTEGLIKMLESDF